MKIFDLTNYLTIKGTNTPPLFSRVETKDFATE